MADFDKNEIDQVVDDLRFAGKAEGDIVCAAAADLIDQLRQRVAEVEDKRDLNARMLTEELTRNEHLEAKLAQADQDARRYRWLRDNCHHNEYDGRDWPHAVIVLQWDDGSHICKFHPDKNAPGVGLVSLDNAIDIVMQRATIAASGEST